MGSRLDRAAVLAGIKGAIDVEGLLADLGASAWHRRGDELQMSCILPFGFHPHGDRRPSASFNASKLVYWCFVCGGGDIIWLVQSVLGVGRDEALGLLRRGLEDADQGVELRRLLDIVSAVEEAFEPPVYDEKILDPWKCYSAYLDDRGVDRAVQRRMKTGVDLASRERIGSEVADAWIEQPRLVIPLFWHGGLRGWQKRKLDDRQQVGPKYLNTKDFPRSRALYNLQAQEHGIVIESPSSVLRMMSEGDWSPVATFGSVVAPEQAAQMRSFERVTVFFDADDAGLVGTARLVEMLRGHTRVDFVPSWEMWPDKPGRDPADMPGPELREALGEARPEVMMPPLREVMESHGIQEARGARRRAQGSAKGRARSWREGAKRKLDRRR